MRKFIAAACLAGLLCVALGCDNSSPPTVGTINTDSVLQGTGQKTVIEGKFKARIQEIQMHLMPREQIRKRVIDEATAAKKPLVEDEIRGRVGMVLQNQEMQARNSLENYQNELMGEFIQSIDTSMQKVAKDKGMLVVLRVPNPAVVLMADQSVDISDDVVAAVKEAGTFNQSTPGASTPSFPGGPGAPGGMAPSGMAPSGMAPNGMAPNGIVPAPGIGAETHPAAPPANGMMAPATGAAPSAPSAPPASTPPATQPAH